jgi:hypothetical protein
MSPLGRCRVSIARDLLLNPEIANFLGMKDG